ncbi:AEC family transporter [Ornithinibacillus halotolerans]|uniref:Membrane protein n=1 Tax=Ornithinibacillus halotolerans TaxID=1274357 RepID=A0A916S257_9BACI|nr:AEC family transporter [Ornithinibacillus halotolerans]GGA79859.1 membrane protein [Ornithinibacillus halotolerans]
MNVFIEVVLPVLLVFGSGYALQKIRLLDVKSVSAVSIYLFVPCLVFTNMYESTFDTGFKIIIVFSLLLMFVMIILNKVLAKILNWDKSVESGSILATAFMNAGNFGVPVILFSVGEEALPYAVFYMVIHSLIMNFFGIYYASRSQNGIAMALKSIMKMPATYAIILALLLKNIGYDVPTNVYSILQIMGEASIPLLMVVLGMQLGNISLLKFNWPVISVASILRLIVSPILAWFFISFFNLEYTIVAVLLIVSAMPSAATTTLYAVEYDAEPELVSSITLVTTILSIITLSVMLNII